MEAKVQAPELTALRAEQSEKALTTTQGYPDPAETCSLLLKCFLG